MPKKHSRQDRYTRIPPNPRRSYSSFFRQPLLDPIKTDETGHTKPVGSGMKTYSPVTIDVPVNPVPTLSPQPYIASSLVTSASIEFTPAFQQIGIRT